MFRSRLIYIFVVLLGACSTSQEATQEKPLILATTGMIGDAVSHIVGDTYEVASLMGPGVDPHLYKATPKDLQMLRKAGLVCYNGLYLEGKMGEILEKLAQQKPVYAVAEALDREKLLGLENSVYPLDPHIWFDVALWREAVMALSEAIIAFDTENAQTFRSNAQAFADSLENLDTWVKAELEKVPKERRVLITAHDAFGYFGRAYEIEVRGLQGISTVSEFGLKDIQGLVDFIVSRKIKAVFVESSIPRRSLEAVVSGCNKKGHQVQIGGTLYSDAMGAKGTPAGNYIGMVKENVTQIVGALK